MSVSVEKLENSMAVLTIEVDAKEFDKAVDKVYLRQRSRLSVPGFRKGKTPRKLIERMYGEGIFLEDAANDVINETYPAEAEACGEEIVSSPEIEITQIGHGQSLIYKATVAVKPPVTLKEQDKNATFEEVTDRTVQDGDQIKLDFEGFVDGVAFEGGKGEDYPLTIGSGSFIPGFEEQLVGAEIGKEMEVNVTFPENYGSPDLAGADAVFKCTVHSIREKHLPELNDEFADDVSEFETLDEFKEDIRRKLIVKKEEAARTEMENEAVDAVIKNATVQIPDAMLKTQERQMVDEFAQQLQYQGMTIDQYFEYSGNDRDKMMEVMAPQAEKRILTRLVLEQIVKEENITVSEEDFEEELQKLAASYGADLDTVKNIFVGKERERMEEDIAVQKAVSFVADHAVEVEKAEEAAETEEA